MERSEPKAVRQARTKRARREEALRRGAGPMRLWMLLACGCVAREVPIFDLPPLAGGSAIIAATSAGEWTVYASDLDEGVPRSPLRFAIEEDAALFALAYGCPLDALGLQPGKQTVEPDESGVRPPARSWTADASGAWVEGALPELFDAIRIGPPRSLCLEFDARAIEIGSTALAVADGDRVLMATPQGEFFAATLEGAMPLASISTSTPHLAGFRADDGKLWLFGDGGALSSGTLEAGFVEEPPSPLLGGRSLAWIDGARGAEFELYVVTDDHGFERFDGGWTVLENDIGGWMVESSGVAWVGPDEALAVGLTGPPSREVRHYQQGSVRDSVLPTIADDDVATAVASTHLGAIAGTRRGAVLLFDGVGWEMLGEELGFPVYTVADLQGGFIAGGARIAQYAGGGFCPSIEISDQDIVRIVSLEEGSIAIPRSGDPIALLPRADPCSIVE